MPTTININLGQVCLNKRYGAPSCRGVPHSPNRTLSMHWGLKYRWTVAWKEITYYATLEALKGKRPKGKVVLQPFLFTMSPMDDDNAMASLKPVIDGMKAAHAMVDDSPKYCEIRTPVTIRVGHKVEEHVKIELTF